MQLKPWQIKLMEENFKNVLIERIEVELNKSCLRLYLKIYIPKMP